MGTQASCSHLVLILSQEPYVQMPLEWGFQNGVSAMQTFAITFKPVCPGLFLSNQKKTAAFQPTSYLNK